MAATLAVSIGGAREDRANGTAVSTLLAQLEAHRVYAGDIEVGDYVARTRGAVFYQVASIRKGEVAVRLLDERGQTIARPRRTASWWRIKAAEKHLAAAAEDHGVA